MLLLLLFLAVMVRIMHLNQESSWQYWPSIGKTVEFGEYTVDLLSEEVLEGLTTRILGVLNNKVSYYGQDKIIYYCVVQEW